MGLYDDAKKTLTLLVGQQIDEVWWSEERITFVNDKKHMLSFEVEGDCCSHSYFYDFIGLDKLLGHTVLEVGEIALTAEDKALAAYMERNTTPRTADPYYDEDIKVYGYKIVSEHPDWGPVTTVFSFRNSSNGYYGGWMYPTEGGIVDQVKLTADKVGG